MPTTQFIPGQAPVTWDRPRDLLTHTTPALPIPRQPIANHAAELAEFQAACTAALAQPNLWPAAFGVLGANHVSARVDDVPEAARTAAKRYVRDRVGRYNDLNSCLDDRGSEGAWRA